MLTRALKRTLRTTVHALVGALVVAVAGFAYFLDSRPDLEPWHIATLDEEYSAASEVADFAGYLALEERLFAQLETQVHAQVMTGQALNRFSRGSLSDPARWPRDWNRSYELANDAPRAGVLLLHGLSDSPYSLRPIGERLADAGATVLGLRLPGHGTAPAGLVDVRWQDMAAAVKLAMRHLATQVGEQPIHIVGYSNGGALGLEYALAALVDASLPRPAGVVLISPSIAVSGLAVLAAWQRRLGNVLGLEKLAWSSIGPEYDPYKYNSFAINAGDLAHRMTTHLQARLQALAGTGQASQMPPILAFQSAVDATVSASALATYLFCALSPGAGHELVLFDINREALVDALLTRDPKTEFEPMLRQTGRGFDLTVVSNVDEESAAMVARREPDNGDDVIETPLDARWPPAVYSLSHVALSFPPDDPLYGGPDAAPSPGVALGNIAAHGERGLLRISGDERLRMRWNPFYDYMESRILGFMSLN